MSKKLESWIFKSLPQMMALKREIILGYLPFYTVSVLVWYCPKIPRTFCRLNSWNWFQFQFHKSILFFKINPYLHIEWCKDWCTLICTKHSSETLVRLVRINVRQSFISLLQEKKHGNFWAKSVNSGYSDLSSMDFLSLLS